MAVSITFVTHATSLDNEAGLASGHSDVALSDRGRREAREAGQRFAGEAIAAAWSSDLRRAWETAEIAFEGGDVPLHRDPRLRECDYGDLTRRPTAEVDALRPQCIDRRFPGGESYEAVAARVRDFVHEVARDFAGRRIVVVGHRATQHALEHVVNGVPLREAVAAPWGWRPRWEYVYEGEGVGR